MTAAAARVEYLREQFGALDAALARQAADTALAAIDGMAAGLRELRAELVSEDPDGLTGPRRYSSGESRESRARRYRAGGDPDERGWRRYPS